MTGEELRGLAVVGIAEARRLGTIEHVFLDSAARRVVAFGVLPIDAETPPATGALDPAGAAFPSTPPPLRFLPTAAVRSLGADAAMVAGAADLVDALPAGTAEDSIPLGTFGGRDVVDAAGEAAGQVASVAFDPSTYAFSGIEVAHGLIRRRSHIPADLVGDLDADPLVIRTGSSRLERGNRTRIETPGVAPSRRTRGAATEGSVSQDVRPRRQKSTKAPRPPRGARRRSR